MHGTRYRIYGNPTTGERTSNKKKITGREDESRDSYFNFKFPVIHHHHHHPLHLEALPHVRASRPLGSS